MNERDSHGFSLIELAITVLVVGILMAFTVPAFQSMSNSERLVGATGNLAAQVRLAREKAISTGQPQTLRFLENTSGADYHVYNGGVVGAKWDLPRKIGYDWTSAGTLAGQQITLLTDGRADRSGLLILRDSLKGNRDTVSIQISGLVLTK